MSATDFHPLAPLVRTPTPLDPNAPDDLAKCVKWEHLKLVLPGVKSTDIFSR